MLVFNLNPNYNSHLELFKILLNIWIIKKGIINSIFEPEIANIFILNYMKKNSYF